jgi:hypothetical protein
MIKMIRANDLKRGMEIACNGEPGTPIIFHDVDHVSLSFDEVEASLGNSSTITLYGHDYVLVNLPE